MRDENEFRLIVSQFSEVCPVNPKWISIRSRFYMECSGTCGQNVSKFFDVCRVRMVGLVTCAKLSCTHWNEHGWNESFRTNFTLAQHRRMLYCLRYRGAGAYRIAAPAHGSMANPTMTGANHGPTCGLVGGPDSPVTIECAMPCA